jgi:hypothetical protein
MKLFENSVLREIFGPKREEVEVGWRKLHKVARMGEIRNAYNTMAWEREGKKTARKT